MIDDMAALRAARNWARKHGHPEPGDRMLREYGAALAELPTCGAPGPVGRRCAFPEGHEDRHGRYITETWGRS